MGRSTTRWQLSADHHLGCAEGLSSSRYLRGELRRRLTRDEFPALGEQRKLDLLAEIGMSGSANSCRVVHAVPNPSIAAACNLAPSC